MRSIFSDELPVGYEGVHEEDVDDNLDDHSNVFEKFRNESGATRTMVYYSGESSISKVVKHEVVRQNLINKAMGFHHSIDYVEECGAAWSDPVTDDDSPATVMSRKYQRFFYILAIFLTCVLGYLIYYTIRMKYFFKHEWVAAYNNNSLDSSKIELDDAEL